MAYDHNDLDQFPISGGTVVAYLPGGAKRSLAKAETDAWRGKLRSGARLNMPADAELHGRLVRRMNFTCCGERETIALFLS